MRIKLNQAPIVLIVIITSLFFVRCSDKHKPIYQLLMRHADTIKIVNTHEHQRKPSDYDIDQNKFYEIMYHSYLSADLISSGSPDINHKTITEHSLAELWDLYGQYLNYSCNTSYYKHLNMGFQILYDYKEKRFTKSNIKTLSKQIDENYKDYNTWFKKAYKSAGYEVMLIDQYWNPFNVDIDTNYFALVFNINKIVQFEKAVFDIAEKEQFKTDSFDQYLSFTDYLFNKFIENDVVCLKNTLAYLRTIIFENNISIARAKSLYTKRELLSDLDKKSLEDFMFHWIIQKSVEYDLPIQIHTGYLAGNGYTLENGNPIKLNNLFLQYPEAKFILFHGGYPWTSEFIAFGKTFANVYLDLVWLPQISKTAAIQTFDEMLDCVPYNKILWGGDGHFIEESVGSLAIGKDVVVSVLSDRIQRGELTEEVAMDMIIRIFRENAIDIFKLGEKLSR